MEGCNMDVEKKASHFFIHTPMIYWVPGMILSVKPTYLNNACFLERLEKQMCREWTFDSMVNTFTSHIRVLGFNSQLQLLTLAFCQCGLWKAVAIAQIGFLLPVWGTWITFLVSDSGSGLSPAQSQLLQVFKEWTNGWELSLHLFYISLPLSF